MIKANELRIGNLLWRMQPTNIQEVYDISSDGGIHFKGLEERYFDLDEDDQDGLKPIPLSKEWLQSLGFAEDNYYRNNYVIKSGDEYYSVHFQEDTDQYYRGWIVNNDQSDALCHRIAKVEYIHQLQNLYFALTREELTIKEPV